MVPPLGRPSLNNTIVDGLIYVGDWQGCDALMQLGSTGVTIRNCLALWPAVQRQNNVLTANKSFVKLGDRGGTYNADVAAAPIRIYNNTMVTERTQSQNVGIDPGFIEDESYFENVVEENNVVHKPSMNTPTTTFAPLVNNGTPLWTPRNIGRRSPGDFKLQVTQVVENDMLTPPNAVQSYRPAAGSPALGAALTGDVSYMDMTFRKRPEPPSVGAWEME